LTITRDLKLYLLITRTNQKAKPMLFSNKARERIIMSVFIATSWVLFFAAENKRQTSNIELLAIKHKNKTSIH